MSFGLRAQVIITGVSMTEKSHDMLKPLLEDELLTQPKHNISDIVGRSVTFLAMVGPGVFAGLLMADLIKNTSFFRPFLTAILSPIVAFASLYGKYSLVYFFNRGEWVSLFQKSWRQLLADLNPFTWLWSYDPKTRIPWFLNHLLGILNGVLIITTSLTFGGLTRVSFNETHGAGYLANELGWSWGNDYLFSVFWFQLTFILSAIFANLLGYSHIHHSGFAVLLSLCGDLFNVFFPTKDDESDRIAAVKSEYIAFCNEVNGAKFAENINQILECMLVNSLSAAKINLIQYYESQETFLKKHYQNNPQTFLHRLVIWLVGLFAVCSSVVAFSNFIGMNDLVNIDMPDYLKLPGLATLILGYMTFISMGLLGTSVYEPAKDYAAEKLGYRQRQLNYYDSKTARANNNFATWLCLIGVTPNVYQALLDKQAPWLIFIAAFGSFILEMPAVNFMYHNDAMQDKIAKCKDLHIAHLGVGLFDAINSGVSEDEFLDRVKELSEVSGGDSLHLV